MAGGRFDKLVGKTRPGTYINFESGREQAVISAGTRGTVIIPLPKASYGPAKKFIKLTNASPDAEAATFGYSIYDDDPNRQMLLVREAFKRATTVYAYILTEGEKATAEIEMALPEQEATEISTAVSEAIAENMGAKETEYILPLAAALRSENVIVEIYPDSAKLRKQFEYADRRGIPFLSITGASEMEAGSVNIKNLASGEQRSFSRDDTAAILEFLK